MSADRELLELAAKASGHGLPGPEDTDEIGRQYVYSLGLWVNFPWGFDWWAPLTDDGDAFRLAVRLGITLRYARNAPPELGVPRECAMVRVNGEWFAEAPQHGDENAATRRAIVRAAAELGKDQP